MTIRLIPLECAILPRVANLFCGIAEEVPIGKLQRAVERGCRCNKALSEATVRPGVDNIQKSEEQ